ncbi:MAG TPA: FtsX-like permease family protein [Alphaproteobacteria bacterium]|nr:FtsX-like permease family protein [Alphaproteobacteria bacterium]
MRADGPGLGLAFALARRELRGGFGRGFRGFRVFLACLVLGVGAIAAVGTLGDAVDRALTDDARTLLGGDAELTIGYRTATPAELASLDASGTVSGTVDMRAMVRAAIPGQGTGKRFLIELKAVDRRYPLFGTLVLAPAVPRAELFAERDGVWGAAVDREALDRLGLKLGETVKVGAATYQLRAAIESEPDRGSATFILGPRFMVGRASLAATKLIEPGSLVYYHYRVKLPPGRAVGPWLDRIEAAFPDAGWRARSFDNAAPRLKTFLDRIALYLVLVGLTSLLVGGVGVANAIKAYLDRRATTIAILKCLGAPARLVFQVYFIETLALAFVGIALGLALGALVPILLSGTLARLLPVVADVGLAPRALALAAAYGLLTTIVFTLWPLAHARDLPAARLFRAQVAPERRWPRALDALALGVAGAALAALTILSAAQRPIALWFVLGSVASFAAFRAAAWIVARLARASGKLHRLFAGAPTLRLALANLHRPAAPTASVILSLGVGLTLFIAVALVEGNIAREVTEELPRDAPSFFFIDIQPDQVAPFDRAVRAVPGAGAIEQVPSLRGRIVALNGVPAARAKIDPRGAWALDSDRGLTYAASPPRGTRLVAGRWWPADYRGPPLVSLDAGVAHDFHLGIGDTITVNVLGRELTARIASLRDVDWRSLGINFVMLFSPGILDGAPQTYIATVHSTPAAEEPLLGTLTDRFPNVTAIRVKDALDAVADILANVGVAVRLTALFTFAAGILVLGGAIAAEHRRRTYDAVVLKVLGATRATLLAAFLIEFGILGAASAAVAAALGTLAGWLVTTRIMHAGWAFLPGPVAATLAGATLLTLVLGYLGTWRALGRSAAPVLREP